MTPKVYIETSIPSFYYDGRIEPEMVARRQWTRQWWDAIGGAYQRMTSVAVINELSNWQLSEQRQSARVGEYAASVTG